MRPWASRTGRRAGRRTSGPSPPPSRPATWRSKHRRGRSSRSCWCASTTARPRSSSTTRCARFYERFGDITSASVGGGPRHADRARPRPLRRRRPPRVRLRAHRGRRPDQSRRDGALPRRRARARGSRRRGEARRPRRARDAALRWCGTATCARSWCGWAAGPPKARAPGGCRSASRCSSRRSRWLRSRSGAVASRSRWPASRCSSRWASRRSPCACVMPSPGEVRHLLHAPNLSTAFRPEPGVMPGINVAGDALHDQRDRAARRRAPGGRHAALARGRRKQHRVALHRRRRRMDRGRRARAAREARQARLDRQRRQVRADDVQPREPAPRVGRRDPAVGRHHAVGVQRHEPLHLRGARRRA